MTVDALYALYNAIANSEWDRLRSALHEDCVLGAPGSLLGGRFDGADAIVQRMQQVQALLGGTLRFDFHWTMISPDNTRAVAQWYCFGQPEVGGSFRNRGVALLRFRDGLVIDWQEFYDTELVAAIWPQGDDVLARGELVSAIWPEGEGVEPRGNLELLLSRAEPMDNDWAS